MIKLAARSGLTFSQVCRQLSDGKGYKFSTTGMLGYFYKAPFPNEPKHTERDGALSAITYWAGGKPASPVLMLYDFDSPDWSIEEASWPI